MPKYDVKCQRPNSTSFVTHTVNASSASQAKEQIKAKYNGQIKIIATV